jgi:hypothetical protein
VSPHEIVVVNEEHYMELWTEMGDWLEDDGIDEEVANTLYVCSSTVHFDKSLVPPFVLKCNLTPDFRTMICRTQLIIAMSKMTTQQR